MVASIAVHDNQLTGSLFHIFALILSLPDWGFLGLEIHRWLFVRFLGAD
jgi:hypothetical protein